MNHNLGHSFEADSRELQEVVGVLAKITSRSPEEIKPHVESLIVRLRQTTPDNLAEHSFYETSTPEAWQAEFHGWVDSHQAEEIPVLSDEAMSRDGMYPDRW